MPPTYTEAYLYQLGPALRDSRKRCKSSGNEKPIMIKQGSHHEPKDKISGVLLKMMLSKCTVNGNYGVKEVSKWELIVQPKCVDINSI